MLQVLQKVCDTTYQPWKTELLSDIRAHKCPQTHFGSLINASRAGKTRQGNNSAWRDFYKVHNIWQTSWKSRSKGGKKWVKSTLKRKNYGPYKGYVCVSPTERYYSPWYHRSFLTLCILTVLSFMKLNCYLLAYMNCRKNEHLWYFIPTYNLL